VTYTVHLWLVGKRVVDFLLVLIELFSPTLTVDALWADRCRNRDFRNGLFERGWVNLNANFRGKGSSTDDCWRQKTRVTGLSRGVVGVILRLAVLIQYRRVTHRHTHTHRHTMMANTRASLAPRG